MVFVIVKLGILTRISEHVKWYINPLLTKLPKNAMSQWSLNDLSNQAKAAKLEGCQYTSNGILTLYYPYYPKITMSQWFLTHLSN